MAISIMSHMGSFAGSPIWILTHMFGLVEQRHFPYLHSAWRSTSTGDYTNNVSTRIATSKSPRNAFEAWKLRIVAA